MPSTGQELDLRCYRARDAGRRALDQVLPAVSESPAKASAYTIKGRVKTKQDIFDKVLRKRSDPDDPRPDYEPETMTDIAGIRIVTLFQPDIVDAVSYLLKMIAHDDTVASRPFIKNGLVEVLVFTNTPSKNPLSIAGQVVDVVHKAGFGTVCKPPKESESGYSSVHLIVRTQVETEYETGKSRPMPFALEIQVRTVFEDAWGEVDHKLRYRDRRKSDRAPPDARLLAWLPHLNALKTYVDGCTQYADIIKRQAIDLAPGDPRAKGMVPIESVQEALAAFASCSDEIRQKLRSAYSARERMTTATTDENRIQFASETIEEFEKIEKEEGAFLAGGTEQASRLRYFIRMEQAFAQMHRRDSRDPDAKALNLSIGLYENLAKEYDQDSVVFYRLAWALALAGRHAEAIPHFERAMELL